MQATFSSATIYDTALKGIDGLGFRLAAPCYEQARARGAKPTWQSMNQAETFANSHSLILATTKENATIWLQQLLALSGVQTVTLLTRRPASRSIPGPALRLTRDRQARVHCAFTAKSFGRMSAPPSTPCGT